MSFYFKLHDPADGIKVRDGIKSVGDRIKVGVESRGERFKVSDRINVGDGINV